MRILIAAGGTGGHIYPALAVIRSLQERRDDVDIVWVGGHRGLESKVVAAAGFPLRRLWLRSLRTVDLSVATALDPLRLGASFSQALALLARVRPRAVFTTGGYVAIPVLTAAASLRTPALLWEGNRIPGRSVRATARLATALAVSYADTCTALPGTCYPTGTPIRSLAGIDRSEARVRLGLPPDLPCLLIFGGSQAVRRFNSAVAEALPQLVERVSVLHVTGESGYAEALRGRETLPTDRRPRYRPHPFLRDEMGDALVAADLVVGRAGSSTLAEVTAVGVPTVVVPYPHAAGHQAANVGPLIEAGAARVIPDEAFDASALLRAIEVLDDPEARRRISDASRELGRPGAADAAAELVLALAERRPLPGVEAIDRMARGTP